MRRDEEDSQRDEDDLHYSHKEPNTMPLSNNLKTWARRLLGPLVQNLVKSRVVSGLTWKEKLPLTPIGEFVDSKCRRFERLGGYRDRIVPHWPGMFDDRPKSSTVAKDEIVFARATVEQAEALLKVHGHSFIDAVVLEIGCHGGAHAFSIAGIGAKHVDGIDIPDYGIRQSPSKKTDQKTIAEQSSWLSKLRSDVSRHYGEGLSAQTNLCDRIEFHDLDIKDLEKQAV